jgi:hypothetical protein
MDRFDYHCSEHGVVSSVARDEIGSAHLPTLCPECDRPLSVEVRREPVESPGGG